MATQKSMRRRGRPRTARIERRATLRPILSRTTQNAETNSTLALEPLILPATASHNESPTNNLNDLPVLNQTILAPSNNVSRADGSQHGNRGRERNRKSHNAEERHRKERINRWISKLGVLLMKDPGERQSKCIVLEKAYNYIAESEMHKGKSSAIDGNCITSVEYIRFYSKVAALEHSLVLLLTIMKERSIDVPQEVKTICKQHFPNFNQSLLTASNNKRICNFMNFFNKKKRKLSQSFENNQEANVDFKRFRHSCNVANNKQSSYYISQNPKNNDTISRTLFPCEASHNNIHACKFNSAKDNQVKQFEPKSSNVATFTQCKNLITNNSPVGSQSAKKCSNELDKKVTGVYLSKDSIICSEEGKSPLLINDNFNKAAETDSIITELKSPKSKQNFEIDNLLIVSKQLADNHSYTPALVDNTQAIPRNSTSIKDHSNESLSILQEEISIKTPSERNGKCSSDLLTSKSDGNIGEINPLTQSSENIRKSRLNHENSKLIISNPIVSSCVSVMSSVTSSIKSIKNIAVSSTPDPEKPTENILIIPNISACTTDTNYNNSKESRNEKILVSSTETINVSKVPKLSAVETSLSHHSLNNLSEINPANTVVCTNTGIISTQHDRSNVSIDPSAANQSIFPVEALLPTTQNLVLKLPDSTNINTAQTVYVTQKLQVHSKISSLKTAPIKKSITTKSNIHTSFANISKRSAPNKRWGSVVETVLKNDMFMTSFVVGKKTSLKTRNSQTTELGQSNHIEPLNLPAKPSILDLPPKSIANNSEPEVNESFINNISVSKTNFTSSKSINPSAKITNKKSPPTTSISGNNLKTIEIPKLGPLVVSSEPGKLPQQAKSNDLRKELNIDNNTIKGTIKSKPVCDTAKPTEYSAKLSKENISLNLNSNEVRNKFLEIEKTPVHINTNNLSNFANTQCVSPVISFPKNLASKISNKQRKTNALKPVTVTKDTVVTSKTSSKSFTAEALCKPASNNLNNEKSTSNQENLNKQRENIQYKANNNNTKTRSNQPLKQNQNTQKVNTVNKNQQQSNQNLINSNIPSKLKHQPDIPGLPTFLNVFHPSHIPTYSNQIPGNPNQIQGNNNTIPGNNNHLTANTDHSSTMSTGLSNFSAEALLSGTMNMLNTQYQEPPFPDTMMLHNTNNLFTNFSADTLVNDNSLPYGIDNLIAQNNTAQCWNPHPWPEMAGFPEQLFPTNNMHFNQPQVQPQVHALPQPQPNQVPQTHQRINQPHQRFPIAFPNIQNNMGSQNHPITNRVNYAGMFNRFNRPLNQGNKSRQRVTQKLPPGKQIESSPIKSITSFLEPPNDNLCKPNNNPFIPMTNVNQSNFVSGKDKKITTNETNSNQSVNQFNSNNNFHMLKPHSGNEQPVQAFGKKQKTAKTVVQQNTNRNMASKSGPSFGNFSLVNSS